MTYVEELIDNLRSKIKSKLEEIKKKKQTNKQNIEDIMNFLKEATHLMNRLSEDIDYVKKEYETLKKEYNATKGIIAKQLEDLNKFAKDLEDKFWFKLLF